MQKILKIELFFFRCKSYVPYMISRNFITKKSISQLFYRYILHLYGGKYRIRNNALGTEGDI